MAARVIAFYLPQFHPSPRTTSGGARGSPSGPTSSRRGRVPRPPPAAPAGRPRLLRPARPEVRAAQAELARAHGIDAFCYYHYWFEGRRLLERPFDEVLASGQPDFPFCLCWANEQWTAALGRPRPSVLDGAADYAEADDRAHIALARARRFATSATCGSTASRCSSSTAHEPARPRRTTDIWRERRRSRLGVGELCLCRVESFRDERGDPAAWASTPRSSTSPTGRPGPGPAARRRLAYGCGAPGSRPAFVPGAPGVRLRRGGRARCCDAAEPRYPRFPGVTPSWDNTPRRRGDGVVLTGSTRSSTGAGWSVPRPGHARSARTSRWCSSTRGTSGARATISSPSQRFGRGYLEATRAAIHAANGTGPAEPMTAVTAAGLEA